MVVRLADFIRTELEPILQNWEDFARTILPARDMDKSGLRDHASQMLLAIADDLDRPQSDRERAAKSKGNAPQLDETSWAETHGGERNSSGFSVMDTVSEFRALRASVVSLWTATQPTITGELLDDLTRFHEAIDQAVAESLECYATTKEMHTRLFAAILRASPDLIYVLDPEGRLLYANTATVDLFELGSDEIIGTSILDLGASHPSDFRRNLQKVVADQITCRGKFTHELASVHDKRFEYQIAPVLDEDGNVGAAVCISRDVTTQALAEEKIWHSAHHDPLTGLPNRKLFMDRLEQEIKHATRNGRPLAVLFMDLDGFKEVNDSLGHEAGDRLLSQVGQRLTDCVRDDDTVARLGGDEFAAILVDVRQSQGAELVAHRIIDALSRPFDAGGRLVHVSISIGIAFYPTDAKSSTALLANADRAMYRAKHSGSTRMCLFEKADMDEGELA